MKSLTLFLTLLLNSYAFKYKYRTHERFILKASLLEPPAKVVENLLSTGRQLGDVWSYK